ncbi:D-glycero-alpha-D-manno-heptose-1,7-bisphosphate 7-phosphatase [Streptomyces sp. NPDC053069]|uniref:D-glycero-alpha-D-manno-heptose-1,7-bisphosphate 7-phosphatase n=1 Tax=Streptomyces sp. NPDC053069 TaxID=3365695 RepID=UPI0037CE31AB
MNPVSAVLFDRDGTLVADVPYNADPDRVRLLPGAAAAVALARSHGLATGVVSNQSGIGRGLLTADDVRRVNERVDALLGGLDTWEFCPHTPAAGCPCRKPRPGLVFAAAARLGVAPAECLVVGDIAADVLAAHAAGARGLLVPNAATAPAEVTRFAALTAPDVLTAVHMALAGVARPTETESSRREGADAAGPWLARPEAAVPGGGRLSERDAAVPDGTSSSSRHAAVPDGTWSCSSEAAGPGRVRPPRLDALGRQGRRSP